MRSVTFKYKFQNPHLGNCQSTKIFCIIWKLPCQTFRKPIFCILTCMLAYVCLFQPETFKTVSKISRRITFLPTPSQKCQIGIKIGEQFVNHMSKVFQIWKAPHWKQNPSNQLHTPQDFSKSRRSIQAMIDYWITFLPKEIFLIPSWGVLCVRTFLSQ